MEQHTWNNLTKKEKFTYTKEMINKKYHFNFIGFETIQTNLQPFETTIWQYENSEFIFIPCAKNITLGWDHITDCDQQLSTFINQGNDILKDPLPWYKQLQQQEKDENYIYYYQEIIESIKNGSYQFPPFVEKNCMNPSAIENYISQHTSPKRIVDIDPMLVERKPTTIIQPELPIIGTYKIQDHHSSIPLDPLTQKKIHAAIKMEANKIELPGKYIFQLSEDKSTYYINPYTKEKNNLTIKELQTKLEEENFVLLNEDQWEYACGQGSRTLFRWGNSQIPNWYTQADTDWKSVPNNFGLHIATNPYARELISSATYTKGGDGGKTYNSLGEFNHLRFFITFPLSTYYRYEFTPTQNLIVNKYTPPYIYRRAIVF